MKLSTIAKLKRQQQRHTPGIAAQTGFPSPATHYLEPTIDLHQELITNANATFFVRVEGDTYDYFHIYDKAVLIIDRSLPASAGKLALVVEGDSFIIKRIPKHQNNECTLWGVITYVINKAV